LFRVLNPKYMVVSFLPSEEILTTFSL
jgi:hypothetical protein